MNAPEDTNRFVRFGHFLTKSLMFAGHQQVFQTDLKVGAAPEVLETNLKGLRDGFCFLESCFLAVFHGRKCP